jgi:hypothetical protein
LLPADAGGPAVPVADTDGDAVPVLHAAASRASTPRIEREDLRIWFSHVSTGTPPHGEGTEPAAARSTDAGAARATT